MVKRGGITAQVSPEGPPDVEDPPGGGGGEDPDPGGGGDPTGGGGEAPFACYPSGVLVDELDCATITNTPINFFWTWSAGIEYSNYITEDHTAAGMAAAWEEAVGEVPWTNAWHSITDTNCCDFTYTPPPPWDPYYGGAPMPHWNENIQWYGGITNQWYVVANIYRYSPELDLSSLGYTSSTHQAWMRVSWTANDYTNDSAEQAWPYPYTVIDEKCYNVTKALDSIYNFKDELYVPTDSTLWVGLPGVLPLAIDAWDYRGGGWTMSELSIEVYQLP